MTVDGVYKLPQGTTLTPLLDYDLLPRNSRVVIDIARPAESSPGRVSGRFNVAHYLYKDGTGAFKGVITLDAEFSEAVVVGDVLTIRAAEPNGVFTNQIT